MASLWAFRFLLWYICVMMVQPQVRFPILWSLHIADLCIMASLGLHVFTVLQEGKPLLRFGPATKIGCTLIFFGFVSLYIGPLSTSTSWNAPLDVLVKNALLLLLIEAMATDLKRVWALLITVVIASMWWMKAGFRLGMIGAEFASGRMMGAGAAMVENPNGFAYMVCVLIPLFAFLAKNEKGKWIRIYFLSMILLSIYIIMKTGSRSGFLALLVCGLFVLFHYASRNKLQIILAVVALYFIMPLIGGDTTQRLFSTTESIRTFFSGEIKPEEDLTQDEQSAQERRLKNRDTWALIKEYPVFGVGINPNQSLYASRFPFAAGEVHNEILMAGRQMGVIGMGLYLSLLLCPIILGFKLMKRMKKTWPVVSDMGWLLMVQGFTIAAAGFFAPSCWSAMTMIVCGAASVLYSQLDVYEKQ